MAEAKSENLIFSCIQKTKEGEYQFNQNFWNYREFIRLSDIRKYVNSIKKDLIGKTLDKVLFLGELTNTRHVIGKYQGEPNTFIDVLENGSQYAVESCCLNNASAPIVLQFGENKLEIDVGEDAKRSFDRPNYVRLGYNTIPDIENIEKRFTGVNYNARYKEIIGQELAEIIFHNKCNKIEFRFKNNYGCIVYWDIEIDFGTQFEMLSPEYYEANSHRLCAYKKTENDKWNWEYLTSYRNSSIKLADAYFKSEKETGKIFDYWICPDTTFDVSQKPDELLNSMLNNFECDNCYNWFYIPEADKWYHGEEIIDEPAKKPKNEDNFHIELIIDKDSLGYDLHYDVGIRTKKQLINLDNIKFANTRVMNKLISDIKTSKKIKICNYYHHNLFEIIFIYPQSDNRVRLFVRDSAFKGAKYIYDSIIDKNVLIGQLQQVSSKIKKAQKDIKLFKTSNRNK